MKPTPEFDARPASAAADPLGLATVSPRRAGLHRWLLRGGLAVLALGVGGWFAWRAAEPAPPNYDTVDLARGALRVTVSATGTLQPTKQVDIGSELSGTVQSVLVEDNSVVVKGQELARLDVARLKDQIVNATAALAAARAQVRQADATRAEAAANLARQREVYRLSDGKVPSRTELESAEAARERAEASLAAARAAVDQAEAALSTNRTNLAKASIRAPIDGIVLARKVEPGQTVAASLQAPVLFTLAEDLRRMELQVKVDEADVGQVREGQSAEFTVDAYPGRRYPATIRRVAYGATVTDNVVSYLTLLSLDNEDLSLRPGMTATAEILVDLREDVLLVPNAALRFSPPRPPASGGTLVESLLPRPPRAAKQVRESTARGATRRIWVLRENRAEPVEVRVGATNGRMTEVAGDGLGPGLRVITGIRPEGR